MNRIALITGATAGIGKATAKLLAGNNFDLILTGRRKEKLDALKTEIESGTASNALTLCFDVRDSAEVDTAIGSIPSKWQNIDILINNAGLSAGLNPIQDGVIDDWERMIDTNIKGLLYITRRVSPLMTRKKSGHIINISSIAGKETYPGGNVYCATKHAVQSLTEGMRIDMLQHGIKVTSISPGAVGDTEFSIVRFKGDHERVSKVYEGFTPLFAKDIAEAILFVITRPGHVNIDDLVIMPSAQAFARVLEKRGEGN